MKNVDYTLLKPDATTEDFRNLCLQAAQHFEIIRSVCVLQDPAVIALCKFQLEGLGVNKIKVCAVHDFPFGRSGERIRLNQAELLKKSYVDEIDTVIDAGAVKEGGYTLKFIQKNLKSIVEKFDGPVKAILETGHPWYDEKLIKTATEIVAESGAFCVKTSTGFIANIPVEQKVQHAIWMHEAAPQLMIKIAGGIKTKKHAQLFYDVLPKEKLIFGASSKFWLADE